MKPTTGSIALLDRVRILLLPDGELARNERDETIEMALREDFARQFEAPWELEVGNPDNVASPESFDFILTRRAGLGAASLTRFTRCLAAIRLGPGRAAGQAPIDLESARRLGIYVASMPDALRIPWASGLSSLIQAAASRIGIPVSHRRIGFVGFGQVGQSTALLQHRAETSSSIWVYDPFVGDTALEPSNARRAPLEELLGLCHIVVLALPAGPGTRGMIDFEKLALMRADAALINGGSCALVDAPAVARALLEGQLGALGWTDESMPRDLQGPEFVGRVLRRPPPVVPEDAAKYLADSTSKLILGMLRGDRPPHLLIDPPCPRHVLVQAGIEA